MRVGILGGTFDPVHQGHLILAEWAREELALERVLFVPAGSPWRKAERHVQPVQHRLAMVRLAIEGHPSFQLSTLEADQERPSYTARTLEIVARQQPGSELFFLLGQDALADLPNWRRPQRILEQAALAVARRGGVEPVPVEAPERAVGGLSPRIVWLTMPVIDISASLVRERVGRGLSVTYLVPASVEAYIAQRGLYRGTPSG